MRLQRLNNHNEQAGIDCDKAVSRCATIIMAYGNQTLRTCSATSVCVTYNTGFTSDHDWQQQQQLAPGITVYRQHFPLANEQDA